MTSGQDAGRRGDKTGSGAVLPECVFIVGSSRSGTTMMAQMLGRHPAMCYFYETHFFEHLWAGLDQEEPLAYRDARDLVARLYAVTTRTILRVGRHEDFYPQAEEFLGDYGHKLTPARLFLNFLRSEAQAAGRQVPVEQTPRNVFYLQEILGLYPNCKVIHMVRDPRAVLLSKKYMWRRALLGQRNIPWRECVRQLLNYHPVTVTLLWRAAVRQCLSLGDDPRVLTVRYEDVVADPHAALREVCDFLNVPFEATMLEIPVEGSSLDRNDPTASGVQRTSVEKWRQGGLSRSERWICERLTCRERGRYGFAEEAVRPAILGVTLIMLWFPVHAVVAMGLALARNRRIGESLRRRLGKR